MRRLCSGDDRRSARQRNAGRRRRFFLFLNTAYQLERGALEDLTLVNADRNLRAKNAGSPPLFPRRLHSGKLQQALLNAAQANRLNGRKPRLC